MDRLTHHQLTSLIRSVFSPEKGEKGLTLLTDVPSDPKKDHPEWKDRRSILREWYDSLVMQPGDLPFTDLRFCTYPDVGSNNNDLPDVVSVHEGEKAGTDVPLISLLESSSVVIAMTEFSATAPLKVLGKKLGFRGATMPGFNRRMIPALGLDYEKVHLRVSAVKNLMDKAEAIAVVLSVGDSNYATMFDTRFRNGHASGGLMREPGVVGNLPSGEAYIVPYEGEREGEESRTSGVLPVQFDTEIVMYDITGNRASEVLSTGPKSLQERKYLKEEPAYGNIAEVGIGVLGQWGVEAVGSTLLDEKLGLHVAFGRSEHFGGITGPSSFIDPKRVVHIDRVYVPSVQPLITVKKVDFHIGGSVTPVMRDGTLVI